MEYGGTSADMQSSFRDDDDSGHRGNTSAHHSTGSPRHGRPLPLYSYFSRFDAVSWVAGRASGL